MIKVGKGLWTSWSPKPPFKQGQSRLAWALFWIPPRMETLPPLGNIAVHSHPDSKQCFLVLRVNILCFKSVLITSHLVTRHWWKTPWQSLLCTLPSDIYIQPSLLPAGQSLSFSS